MSHLSAAKRRSGAPRVQELHLLKQRFCWCSDYLRNQWNNDIFCSSTHSVVTLLGTTVMPFFLDGFHCCGAL